MQLEQVCQALKEYLSKFALARILTPLSTILMLIFGAIQVLDRFIVFGSVVSQISFFSFFLMLLLVLSECRFSNVAIGMGLLALDAAIGVVRSLIPNLYINYSAIISLLFYGFFTFVAYKKSLSFRYIKQ